MTLRKGKLIRCRSGVDSSLCEERSKFPKGLGCQLPDRQPLHGMHSMIFGRQFSPFYSQIHSLGA